MGTLPGDRKVGRPVCEDRAYAEDMGVSYRTILTMGGAKYLKRIPESSRNLLFKRLALTGDARTLTALRERGLCG